MARIVRYVYRQSSEARATRQCLRCGQVAVVRAFGDGTGSSASAATGSARSTAEEALLLAPCPHCGARWAPGVRRVATKYALQGGLSLGGAVGLVGLVAYLGFTQISVMLVIPVLVLAAIGLMGLGKLVVVLSPGR